MKQTAPDESKANLLAALSALLTIAESFPDELHKDHPVVLYARAVIDEEMGQA